jgi:hypothetical protein
MLVVGGTAVCSQFVEYCSHNIFSGRVMTTLSFKERAGVRMGLVAVNDPSSP